MRTARAYLKITGMEICPGKRKGYASGSSDFPMQRFCHDDHQNKQNSQEERIKSDVHVLCQQTEERGDETAADVGECHLYADDGLAQGCAEIGGGLMDQRRVDRSTAASDQDERSQQNMISKRKHGKDQSKCRKDLPQSDHIAVAELHRDETADKSSSCDADVEQTRPLCRLFCGNPTVQRAVAGCPHTGGCFDGAVAEKADQYFPDASFPKDLGKCRRFLGNRLVGVFRSHVVRCSIFRHPYLAICGIGRIRLDRGMRKWGRHLLPQREGEEKDQGQHHLYACDGLISAVPAKASGDCPTHDHRSDACADAPHTVKPAHMARRIMKCDKIIQRGVHAAGAEAIRNRPEAQHPERMADGKTKQRGGGHQNAERGDSSGAQLPGQPVAGKAGHNRTAGDDHGNNTCPGDGSAQLLVHDRPRGAQQGIRKAETDKCKINNKKQ